MDRQAQKAKYNKDNYDRLEIVVPKGTKSEIKAVCDTMGISVNEFVSRLIKGELNRVHTPKNKRGLLLKWEVKEKYHPMIEGASYSKSQGYYIKLRAGYINDDSSSNEIICRNVKDLRKTMKYTHPIREDLCGFDSKTYEQLLRWQVPKCRYNDIASVGVRCINFKDGNVLKFESVADLRAKLGNLNDLRKS